MLGIVCAVLWLAGSTPAHAVVFTLDVSDATPLPVTEGNSGTVNVSFDITLSGSPAADVTVSYATMYGSATANVDYVYKELSETFLAGATGGGLTKTITVAVNGDTTPEPDENFFVQLYSPTGGAVLGDSFGQAVIANDDAAPPGISVSDATPAPVTEGNAGTTPAAFNVVLSASPTAPVTFKWATNYGTATAGTDYVYAEGTGTFATGTGTLSQPVTIQVNGDAIPEGNETFYLQLYDVGGATVTDAFGLATIQNDDAAVPTISIADDTGPEGGNVVIPVTLSSSPTTAVSVKYTSMPGTYFDTDATPGTDFTAQAGTLNWSAGASGGALTQNVTVPLLVDGADPSEHFWVQIYDPVGGNLAAQRYGKGTISAPPVATADTFSAVGNTKLVVEAAAPAEPHKFQATGDLLENDTDSDGPPGDTLTVTGPGTTTNGGTLTLNPTGSFTYLPAVGFTGADGFTYTLSDGQGNSVPGTVTINVAGRVWYVNNAGGAGDGRSSSPFNSLTPINLAGGGGDQDFIGDVIFLYQGGGNYAGGLPLENDQRLVGQPEGLVVGADTLLAASGSNPTITNATGAGITLANNTTIRRVNVSGTSGAGITGTSIATADIGPNLTVSGSGGIGFSLSGNANGAITFAGSVTHSSSGARSVSIANRTGNTVSISGAVSDTAGGISLATNTGATVNFTGGVTVSSGANAAFSATGGGTVNVTGSANTLASTTGTALNVDSTTIGGSGLTFRSIAVTGNNTIPTNGIVLNGTGSGGLTVTGNSAGSCGTAATEADCTGGTIQGTSTSGAGILLTNATNPSFTRVNLKNNKGSGLKATGVSGLTLANSLVQGSADAGGQTEAGLFLTNLTGTNSLTSSTVKTSFENNILWTATSGSGTLNVTGSTISAAAANDGLHINASSTGGPTLNVSTTAFTSNVAAGIGTNFTGSAAGTVNVTTSTFIDNTSSGITFGTQDDADLTFDVHDNGSLGSPAFLRPTLNAIQLLAALPSTTNSHISGKIRNNFIGDNNADSGSRDSYGIAIEINDDADAVVSITGNNIRHTDQGGIFVQSRDPNTADANPANATSDWTITGNTVGTPDDNTAFPVGLTYGIWVDGRHNTTTCANISGNVAAHSGVGVDFRVRDFNAAVYKLQGYGGGATNAAAVQTFLTTQNTYGGVSAEAVIGGGAPGFTNGTCRTPA